MSDTDGMKATGMSDTDGIKNENVVAQHSVRTIVFFCYATDGISHSTPIALVKLTSNNTAKDEKGFLA